MALGRYNIDRYNVLPGDTLRYTETYDMYSPVTAAFATSSAISPAYFCSQNLTTIMAIGYGYVVEYDLSNELATTITGGSFITPPYALDAALSALMADNLKISPMYDVNQVLSASASANYIVYVKKDMPAAMLAEVLYDIAYYPKYDVYHSLSARFELQSQTIQIMNFNNIIIPAGGILVIDSANCTAYLNNENVIDLYSGDFLWLNKQLLGLDVASNTSGDIDVTLLYRERFL